LKVPPSGRNILQDWARRASSVPARIVDRQGRMHHSDTQTAESTMAKPKKTAPELEALLLERVRKERRCEDVQGFGVGPGPRGVGWIVTHRRLGSAGEFPAEEALSKVLPRLQAEFDLSAED
jgi:hypothetical protein